MSDVLGGRHRFGVLGPSTNTVVQPGFDGMRPVGGTNHYSRIAAILQIGTNLSAVKLCAAAELWFGKPVIAINTATYRHALRSPGITDKIEGFGRLLEAF
jgi:maleate isomerase